jgi:hypothetical protein
MSNEINNSKPEWFQLVDSDAPSAQVRKIDKKLPAVAALVAGAIIATGSFIAGASSEKQDMAQVVAATEVISKTVSKNTGALAPEQVGVKAPTGRDEDDYEDEDEDEDEDERGERDHDRH